jgi:hypothetical protein
LSNIINKSIDHEKYNVRNSHEFRNFVCTQCLPAGFILISLDVVSLFSCIPLTLVENAIESKWKDIEKNTDLNKEDFMRLVRMTMTKSYFQFDSKFYLQIDGTAMGLPISPALADLVMTLLLESISPQLKDDVIFKKKYVDDLCLGVKAEAVGRILEVFNSYHPALQFTLEREEHGKLPFLDLLLVRGDDGSIGTEFYEKKFASGRILSFHSAHPMHQKLNVAQNLVQRMFDFSSGQKPIAKAREKLLNNGFPRGVTNRLINRCCGVKRCDRRRNQIDTILKSLLFVDGVSQKIEKVFKQRNPNFMFAARPRRKVKEFFTKVKDSMDPKSQSNVIYAVKCRSCAERKYVGQTRQKVKLRMSGHRSSLKMARAGLEKKQRTEDTVREAARGSALVFHTVMTGHEFDLENPEILHVTRNPKRLNVLEMLHIQDQKTVNQRSDSANLSAIYKALLEKTKSNEVNGILFF